VSERTTAVLIILRERLLDLCLTLGSAATHSRRGRRNALIREAARSGIPRKRTQSRTAIGAIDG